MPTNTANITAIAQAVKDPDAAKRSRQIYADILTDAQDFLVDELDCLIKIDAAAFTLVASTQEYSLPTDFVGFTRTEEDVNLGQVALGTNAKFPLTPITTELLDLQYANWRAAAAGTPQYFYIVEGAAAKIGLYPAPSSSFISSYGTAGYMKYKYRPAVITDNSDLPFDNSQRLRSLNYLLKLHAIWQIQTEDLGFEAADRVMKQISDRLELIRPRIENIVKISVPSGFSPKWRTSG